MRTLSDTLISGQKNPRNVLVKAVLTHGITTYTYDRTRISKVDPREEEPFSHKATIYLNNSDKTFTDLDLQGFKVELSRGVTTSAGDEYSACAPLWVMSQKLNSAPGVLDCVLECVGIPNLLAEEKAESDYEPTSTDLLTVKGIIADLFDGTMTAFASYPTYTVDWDSEDALIDVYLPKDGFRVYRGQSRLAALRRLLDYTGCAVRFGNDGHIHIFVPTIAGTTYDYQYALEIQTETVRPSGAGDETNIDNQDPAADSHFDKVDEVVADDATTNVYTLSASWLRDLYALGNNVSGQGIIKYVKVYARGYAGGVPVQPSLKIAIKTGGTAYESDPFTLTYATWVTYSKTWATNPQSGVAWTWTDINNLQAGVSLIQCKSGGGAITKVSRCTQVYVEVAYENHTFFAKAYRKRLVIPNKIDVKSQADDTPAYAGTATDTDSYNALGQYIVEPVNLRLDSNVQAASIATAILGKYQMLAEAGSGEVPINVGAEVLDYVKIYDSREGKSRTGNIGWIHEKINLQKQEWRMTFGFGGWYTSRGLLSQLESDPSGIGQFFQKLAVKDLYVENIKATQIDLTTLSQDDIQDGTTFQRVKSTAIDANGMVILDQVVTGTYSYLLATDLSAGHVKLSATVKDGEWYDQTGVVLDATYGASMYGGHVALRTFATSTAYNTWKALANIDDLTGVQCYLGSDGSIAAMAGKITLNLSGLTLTSTSSGTDKNIIFKYNTSVMGYIYPYNGGLAILANDLLIGNNTNGGIYIYAGGLGGGATDNQLDLRAIAGVNITADGANIALNAGSYSLTLQAVSFYGSGYLGTSDVPWTRVYGTAFYASGLAGSTTTIDIGSGHHIYVNGGIITSVD
ncbi:MAG: hypothetical protein WC639_04815 [Patescibacteria group bacterium]|jgi:hypothetical protein